MRLAVRIVMIACLCAAVSSASAQFSMVNVSNNTIPVGGYLLDGVGGFLLDNVGGKLLAR